MTAPAPFEVWQAGMFAGLVLGSQDRTVHSFTEEEIRAEFRSWLDEWMTEHHPEYFASDPHGPCKKNPGHQGRCRNDHGTTWEGRCNAHEHPRHQETTT